MALSDPLGDMLTRIRNGQMANMSVVQCPSSGFRKRVLDVLQREGYIRGFSEVEIEKNKPVLDIELKYPGMIIRNLVDSAKPGAITDRFPGLRQDG